MEFHICTFLRPNFRTHSRSKRLNLTLINGGRKRLLINKAEFRRRPSSLSSFSSKAGLAAPLLHNSHINEAEASIAHAVFPHVSRLLMLKNSLRP
jgi:hypothetical protein